VIGCGEITSMPIGQEEIVSAVIGCGNVAPSPTGLA